MALTEEGVCNLALVRIGQRGLIDDLDEATVEAETCKAVYGPARDAVLASFPWPFATKRSILALVTDGERDGWEYAYALPADCAAPRYIWGGVRNPSAAERIPFAVEHDATLGRILLTDEEDAQLVYTVQVNEAGLFSPIFVQALAWKVAAELALGLSVKPQVGLEMDRKFKAALAEAQAAALREQQADLQPDAETITERR